MVISHRSAFQKITRIKDFVQELVSLISIFTRKYIQVLHGRCFERHVSESLKDITNLPDDIHSAGHFERAKVARPFRKGWFCRHEGKTTKILISVSTSFQQIDSVEILFILINLYLCTLI